MDQLVSRDPGGALPPSRASYLSSGRIWNRHPQAPFPSRTGQHRIFEVGEAGSVAGWRVAGPSCQRLRSVGC